MFGQLGQIAQLLKNAGKIKENMREMRAQLQAARHVGEAGGGQVRVTVDGSGEPVAVKFDPALLQTGDVELIEELTCAAMRDAVSKSREGLQQGLESMASASGLNLPPGLADMLKGQP